MNEPIVNDPLEALLGAPAAHHDRSPAAQRRAAEVEMARVLQTTPLPMASDPANGAIAHWKHGALHDVVEPMADHVIMTYLTGVQRLERRTGKSLATGTARPGVVTIIPAGSSAKWDIPGPVDVIQLYLPRATLERVTREADVCAPGDLLERTGHPDPITSSLLMSAADVLEGNSSLDSLFRQQLTDLLATRLLAAPAAAREGHEHAARYRRINRVGGRRAWLRFANRVHGGVQETDGRHPERMAWSHALTAISLQPRQSRWRGHNSDPVDLRYRTSTTDGDEQWPGSTVSPSLKSYRDGGSSRPRWSTDCHSASASLRRRARK